jgi:hypothetical protein
MLLGGHGGRLGNVNKMMRLTRMLARILRQMR